MINKKEVFILSLTIFLTIISWVTYDLLRTKYEPMEKQNFNEILRVKAEINKDIINLLKNKEP